MDVSVGKSSLANTIHGDEVVKISSDTSKWQAETKSVNGRNNTLIDTPGFFYTDRSEEEQKSEIVRRITEFSPGPHAFLIVLKVNEFTEQEQAVITKINQYFSEELRKYSTVLFTHADQLPEGQTIEDFVRDNKLVSDLVKKCGGRCHVVDNKYWKNNQQEEYRSNQFQVEELLKTTDKMVEANKGRRYTNETLQVVEEGINQEMQLIRQSDENKSAEEIREKAKDRVPGGCLINLAGITTGVSLGALFGVVLMVRVVVSALEAVLDLARSAPGGAAATDGLAVKIAAAVASVVGAVGAAWSLITLTVVSAGVGAVVGGVIGLCAAEGADTLLETAERAAKVVIDGSKTIGDAVKHCLRK